MNRSSGTFTRFLHDPDDPASLSNNRVQDLVEDKTGALWISTANGLNRLDLETGRFTRFLYEAGDPNGEAQDPGYRFTRFHADPSDSSILWVGSERGFLRFDTRSGAYTRHLLGPADPGANHVAGMVHDPEYEDILWIATRGAGLFRFDSQTGRYANYRHDSGDPNSLSSDGLTSIYADRAGIIWLGAGDHGIIKFDPFAAGVEHYGFFPGRANSLSGNTVKGIAEDHTGALWVGFWDQEEGLNRIDRETGRVSRWRIPSVNAIAEDRSGRIWVGSKYTGLNWWDPESGTFTSYRHTPGDPGSLSHDHVMAIYEDRAGTLWIGTLDGLNRMDRRTGTFTHYEYDLGRSGMLSSKAVYSLWERVREPGILWIGTAGGGLNRFDTRTGTFTHFTEKDGLPSNIVWGILEDEQGRLWLSTTNGLSCFDPERRTFRNFGVDSGLQSAEFKDRAHFKSSRGEMFFGGVKGLNAFYPDQMQENPHPPQVLLTGLRLFNRPVVVGEHSVLKQPISMAEEIQLEHDQNSVTFDYVALHFKDPAKNRYAYKLDGFDADWAQAGAQRTATYTNISPGEYHFRVKAANSDGIWNEEGASVRLVILPPWWRTTWAYLLYGLLFASGVFAVDRIQRRRLIRKERERAERNAEQLRAKAEQLRAEAAEHLANYLQSENERQTQELEQARGLQLSMLPEKLPEHPLVEIAAFMKTATEVGGDYYDFDLGGDGTLTLIIGDATGHGLPASTMVTATKGILGVLSREADLEQVLTAASEAVRRMHLPKLYMALALARLRDHTLELVGAGMPPALIYRAATGCIEEVALKGMPLGSPGVYPYRRQCVLLSPGDTVVLMSDGLPELRGESGELLGYERMPGLLAEAANRKPEEIIAHLMGAAKAWCKGQVPDDDMTFLVMKVKA